MNSPKRQAQINKAGRKYNLKMRAAVVAFLGGKCVKCGYFDERALQIDHVYGGGNKERKASNNNKTLLFKKILSGSKDYQLLCANCNQVKRAENHEVGRKWR